MGKNSSPTRLSEEFKQFVRKGIANRILVHNEKGVNHETFADTIVKYFKDNNDKYVELINMEVHNGRDTRQS